VPACDAYEGENHVTLFRPTIAGSLPKPGWLAETEKLWPKWLLEGEALDQAKRDAALIWIKLQEDAGIEIVSDGEQFRTHFVHGFLETVEGIDWDLKTKMGIRNNRYVVDVPTVTGKIRQTRPVHRDEAAFCRAYTKKGLKFTLPGPMTISTRSPNAHYGRRADMAMAFAEILNEEALELEAAGVDTIQFDEPAFNVFMEEVSEWGVEALERAARGLKCTTAVHICYGYGIEANIKWKETLGSRMASVRGNLPRHQHVEHPAGIARMRQFACADLADRPAARQGPSGRLHRCRVNRNRNA
jgi:5-methyltetrahydropteroyltriglutamate--homocysteine methyltransferase